MATSQGVTRESIVTGAIERWGVIEPISPRKNIRCHDHLSRGGGPCPYLAKWRLRGHDYCNHHVPVGGWVAREMWKRQKAAAQ